MFCAFHIRQCFIYILYISGSWPILWPRCNSGGKLAGHVQWLENQTSGGSPSSNKSRTFTNHDEKSRGNLMLSAAIGTYASPRPQLELVHEIWSVSCTALVSIWFLLLSSTRLRKNEVLLPYMSRSYQDITFQSR